MTTITIERDKVERWLSALEVATRFVYQDNRPECEAAVEDLRTALAAPATAPEQPSWQDAPTVPGLWLAKSARIVRIVDEHDIEHLQKYGLPRWFGPIPGDKP